MLEILKIKAENYFSSVPFVKMHSTGNDFIIFNLLNDNDISASPGINDILNNLSNNVINEICHRHYGIGCDQLIIVKSFKSYSQSIELHNNLINESMNESIKPMNRLNGSNESINRKKNINDNLNEDYVEILIYNSDGTLANACGNGTRCVAKLLNTEKYKFLWKKNNQNNIINIISKFLNIKIGFRILKVSYEEETDFYTVNMGECNFNLDIENVIDINYVVNFITNSINSDEINYDKVNLKLSNNNKIINTPLNNLEKLDLCGITRCSENKLFLININKLLSIILSISSISSPQKAFLNNNSLSSLVHSEFNSILNNVNTDYLYKTNSKQIKVNLENESFGYLANIGNSHIVFLMKNLNKINILQAEKISLSKYFKDSINIMFVEILDRKNIKILVWERGAGATLSCSSGACATYGILKELNLIDNEVNAHLSGGILIIKSNEDEEYDNSLCITVSSSAHITFTGQINIKENT